MNQMTTIMEIIHHVLLTSIALRCCKKELTLTLAEKQFQKVQQIHKGYCDGIYFQKRIVSITDECDLKKNSATVIFYIATLINLKTSQIFIQWKLNGISHTFFIHRSREIFLFLMT